MFFKMSFRAWHKHMFNTVQKQAWYKQVENQREIYQNLGKEFIEPEFPVPKQEFEEVEIEREDIFEVTCSDDEIGGSSLNGPGSTINKESS